MRKAIVAIGGGQTMLPIDKEIVRLSGKKKPKLLFIPTASSDAEGYFEKIQERFGKRLKCETDVLYLVRGKPSAAEIRRKIRWADIVYVGGGNTLMMMRIWRRLGVDKLLRAAYGRGTVLAGVSAGSICWFDCGHSDSMSFYDPEDWEYINVRGLGLIHGIHCPHYDGRTRGVPRRSSFRDMMAKIGGVGIAIENNCAIEFVDGAYRVIRSKKSAGAYRVVKSGGKVVSKQIPKTKEFAPIASLFC